MGPVGNPEDRFSQVGAQVLSVKLSETYFLIVRLSCGQFILGRHLGLSSVTLF